MSKSQERRVKVQAPLTLIWLDGLSELQIRALASQHKVVGAMTNNIERLRTDLLMISAVRQLAGELD